MVHILRIPYPKESQSLIDPRSNLWRVIESGEDDTVEEHMLNYCQEVNSYLLRTKNQLLSSMTESVHRKASEGDKIAVLEA